MKVGDVYIFQIRNQTFSFAIVVDSI